MFLLFSYQNYYFPPLFSRFFCNKRLTFVRTLVFHIITINIIINIVIIINITNIIIIITVMIIIEIFNIPYRTRNFQKH